MAAAYSEADVTMQAALLAHGIAEGQYFIDGNKSTAFLACILFLEENGYLMTAPDDYLRAWILDLSSGLTVEAFAGRLRPWVIEQ